MKEKEDEIAELLLTREEGDTLDPSFVEAPKEGRGTSPGDGAKRGRGGSGTSTRVYTKPVAVTWCWCIVDPGTAGVG